MILPPGGIPRTHSGGGNGWSARPAVREERTTLTAKPTETAVRTGTYPIPRFRKTEEISRADLEAAVAYLARK